MPSFSRTVIDEELMCYGKECFSGDTVNSIFILAIKLERFMGVCRRHFPPYLKTRTECIKRTHLLPLFQSDCILLSYFVIYNFVFLEILILMLLTYL